MQARFKFNAWDKKHNKMYYEVQYGLYALNFSDLLENEDFEIIQSTGLKDKNGKLAYFDDLVKLSTGLIGKVTQILDEKSADYGKVIIKSIEEPHNIAAQWYASSLVIKDSEIIGNIYENPELLEKEVSQ